MDRDTNKLVAASASLRSVVAYGKDGTSSVVISGSGVGTGPQFQAPSGIAQLPHSSDYYVVDSAAKAVLLVRASNGDRTVVSDAAKGDGEALRTPWAIAAHPDGHSIVVLERSGSLSAIDSTTGDRTLISGPSRGTGPTFANPTHFVIDTQRMRALVQDATAIVAVDLQSGARSIFSSLQGEMLSLDVESQRLVSRFGSQFFAFTLADATRSTLTASDAFYVPLSVPPAGVFDTDGLWLLDNHANAVKRIDLESGDIAVTSSFGRGVNADPDWTDTGHAALTRSNGTGKLYLAGQWSVLEIDPETAVRRLVQEGEVGMFGAPVTISAIGGELSGTARLAYGTYDTLKSGQPGDEAFAVLTSGSDSAISLATLSSVTVDSRHGRVLTTSYDSGRVGAVGLTSSVRSTLAVSSVEGVQSANIDPDQSTLYVVGSASIDQVNLETGVSTPFAWQGTGKESFNGVAVTRSHLYLTDQRTSALVSIELASKDFHVVSGGRDAPVGMGFLFSDPGDIVLDELNHRAFVVDSGLRAIVSVDLENGDRYIWSTARQRKTTP